MKIQFRDATPKNKLSGTVVFLVADDKKLSRSAQLADSSGAMANALASPRFSGKAGQALTVYPAAAGIQRILLVGAGSAAELDERALEHIGGNLTAQLNAAGVTDATVVLEGAAARLPAMAAHLAHGASLRAYSFDKYHTKKTPEELNSLQALTFVLPGSKAAGPLFDGLSKVADGIFFARDLVTEPPNVINPETMAERCLELKKLGIEVEILGEEEMYRLGMGALLGVGQGSAKESQLVVMRWNGAGLKKGKAAAPIAFIGKGVTFDSGGISIKPATGMDEMKWDMGGAAVVVGTLMALAGRKARVNAVGVIGLVENMPSGNAQRPGDVVTSYSGQTIEVLNTDAEGRLVLADALWYTRETYKPRFMIDLATLTGAIIVALGTSRAGLFSNNNDLALQLADTGGKVGEEVWRMPLADVYDKQINSDIADMQNIGKDREAGSITAAQFLQRFVGDTPWAHLDIAGVAWSKKDSELAAKGATAWGVRLLNQLVADYYE